jgi:zinc protease
MPKSSRSFNDLKLLETFWHESVERYVLPNGLTVVLKPDRSAALASVQVWVKTGSQHEGVHLGAGVSHYLEHMLFKGTERRAGREISATVQAHGGYINAYTTFDRTVYYIDLPSEHTGVAIDLLADAVLHSKLPVDETVKEKDVILREIAMTRDDPDNRFWEALFATAFREHPYRHPIIGYRDVFAAITPDELTKYYRTRYAPDNLVVVVVGDIDVAAVRAAIEQHFGSAPRASIAPVLIPSEPAPLARREQHLFEAVELTRAGLSWHIPGLTHPDAPLLDLLATVLGGGDSSVLWQTIREKAGLVHTIDAQSWNPGSVGLFCVSFTCDAEKREAATVAIEKELLRWARMAFTPAQLKKAVRQMVVGEINTRKTMAGQASRLGAAEVVVGDLNYSRSYFEQIAKATPADLRRMVQTYLLPSRTVSVSLNPAAAKAKSALVAGGGPGARQDFEELLLPNGARLLFQTDHRLPNLHLRLVCLGGVAQEPPGKRGASALLATMLTKDTRKHSAAEIAKFIEEVGGSFHPYSGNNSMGLAVEVLPTDVDRALRVLSEAALEPAFKATTFATEQAAQVADLQQDADDVVTLGRKLLRRKFFGAHPLALDSHGELSGVQALTPADLAALHRKLFVGPNLVLSVAGDFSPKLLLPKLKTFLAKFPKGTPVSLPARAAGAPPDDLPAAVGDFTEKQPREQAVVFQAFPGPLLLSPEFYVGEVADELFSGMASRLFERVREEKGLAYFVRSARIVGLEAGMFYFYAGTAPDKAAEVLAEIEAEIARVQAGDIEDAELSRCRARLKAARRQSQQTNGSRAMQAALNSVYGLPANDWKNYDARIDAVTREDLARLAQRYFQRSRRTQLIVSP